MSKLFVCFVCVLCDVRVFCFNGGPSLVELFIGPKLGSANRRTGRSLDTDQPLSIIQKNGYPAETHEVPTEDGYLLTLHRIPHGRTPHQHHRPVVIQPGLFGASDVWIFRGPRHDISYLLADAGYDVWLANPRGNAYSRRHRTLDPNVDAAFWNYTAHENGVYDLAAVVDYVLDTTGEEKAFLIGYSMGCTSGLVLCALRPEYNDKIRLFLNFGPLAFPGHDLTAVGRLTFGFMPALTHFLEREHIHEILPRQDFHRQFFTLTCSSHAPTFRMCATVFTLTVGGDTKQFNSSAFPNAFKFLPAGTSLKTMKHVTQMFRTGAFKPLGSAGEYDLSKVTVPVSLHRGTSDSLVTNKDVEALAAKLPNVVENVEVTYGKFGHMDYMWPSDDAKVEFFSDVIYVMNKYR